MSEVCVKEVRPGLFLLKCRFKRRLVDLLDEAKTQGETWLCPVLLEAYSEKITLCGSHSGKKFIVAVAFVIKQQYFSTLTSVDFSSDHKLQSQQETQHPLIMWLEGAVSDSDNIQFTKSLSTGKWEISSKAQNISEFDQFPPSLTMWLDFEQTYMTSRQAQDFYTQTQCDVNFNLNGASIGAHLNILSAASPVFDAMFQSGLKECQTREVVIEDIAMEVFKHFLDYLYNSKVPKIPKDEDFEETIELLYGVGDKYMVEGLKNECNKLLQQHLEENSN